ncbi:MULTISPECIES: DUF2332 domain-containing protein [Kitasatospora]|uniref:DUF2332 domain-containing protein n=1 Tax=Kitasatospora setae (strain ATCC 33774 / DSM 43861 / JCM 3304 / KCC A-0304 / NBRC 14216 / KM-6054) TaxID=452652 RepID=E4NBR8_KITSK|nr:MULTISPECIES: DUF2332 domain-containing protein [Kitasatospora]BAJ28649.1 hypothetical protein KSE_28380 [Kitasatospora setae KM-6054]
MPFDHAAAMFHHQADGCAALGSPLSAALLRRAAEDLLAGGPCAEAVAGHEDAPGPDAIALRLLGAVHALVLSGLAPELAAHYPSVGGRFDPAEPDAPWPAFRAAVAAHLPFVRGWLTRPPQTNEVGRANLLFTALAWAQRELSAGTPLPVRLRELGSSAGLNLLADRFRCTSDGFSYGPADSPVVLADAWRGEPPAWLRGAPLQRVTDRRGCDPTPIDPRSADGSLALRAYLWADQLPRVQRLNGALALAAETPAPVEATGAAAFLRGVETAGGTLTVVWHSIMRQYVPADEWRSVEAELTRLATASSPSAPFLHVAFEPRRVGTGHRFLLTARLGAGPRTTLAEAMPHGLPAWTLAPDDPAR